MERDFNHPAIIGWCPFNETWGYREEREKNALLTSLYKLTKRLDPTRPCIDSSGNYRVLSEVYDIHDYDQDTQSFQARWDGLTDRIRETGGVIPAEDPSSTPPPKGPAAGLLSSTSPMITNPSLSASMAASAGRTTRWRLGLRQRARHSRGVLRPL